MQRRIERIYPAGPLPKGQSRCYDRHGRNANPAMRYVIVVCIIALFVIWDGLYNQGRYLDRAVREANGVVRLVTG
jgi:hypothetical protein